jgi:DNA-directed RNA polymerase subunit RPC12/RpoP
MFMAIAVVCSCGQRFNARDDLAGKTVKCPKCEKPLKIPAAGVAAQAGGAPASAPAKAAAQSTHHDVFDEVGLTERGEGVECPSCGTMLPHDAVLCVSCGYNFKLKRRLQTLGATNVVRTTTPEAAKPKSETEKMLIRAEDDLENEPVEQSRGYGSRSSAWLVMLLMVLIAGGVITALIMFFNHMEGEREKREKARKGDAAAPRLFHQPFDVA